jgi:hypothetical protein
MRALSPTRQERIHEKRKKRKCGKNDKKILEHQFERDDGRLLLLDRIFLTIYHILN